MQHESREESTQTDQTSERADTPNADAEDETDYATRESFLGAISQPEPEPKERHVSIYVYAYMYCHAVLQLVYVFLYVNFMSKVYVLRAV